MPEPQQDLDYFDTAYDAYSPFQMHLYYKLKEQWDEYGNSTMTVAGIASDIAEPWVQVVLHGNALILKCSKADS